MVSIDFLHRQLIAAADEFGELTQANLSASLIADLSELNGRLTALLRTLSQILPPNTLDGAGSHV